ncbi:YggS family pyridoxal phosphate-dependent enzyme [bacterium]|nr:YggS family pyridoxal phosphate-dependent enzyme [bacterium]
MSIQNNFGKINNSIAGITTRNVTVVAVTKKHSPEEIKKVISAGAVILGENRVDEAQIKFVDGGLRNEFPEIKLHMIGHLQSRKVRNAVEIFDCIQSVESEKLAREINKRCKAVNKKIDVLIEINVSGEIQKFGVQPNDAPLLIKNLLELENLNLKGLMTMAPFTADESIIRSAFSGLRKLSVSLSQQFGAEFFQVLSMGMSNDYKIAVDEGSTMVRIGTALFE